MSRGPLVAQVVVTGALVAALAWRHGSSLDLAVAVGYVVPAVPLAGLDLRTGRLPNWLVMLAHLLPLAGLIVASVAHPQAGSVFAALVGAIVFIVLYGAWYVFLPGHMGGGDLKLSIATGAVLGWQGWPATTNPYFLTAGLQLLVWLAGALLLIWLLQAVTYVATTAIKRQRSEIGLRHGPFLVLGAVAALLLVP